MQFRSRVGLTQLARRFFGLQVHIEVCIVDVLEILFLEVARVLATSVVITVGLLGH